MARISAPMNESRQDLGEEQRALVSEAVLKLEGPDIGERRSRCSSIAASSGERITTT